MIILMLCLVGCSAGNLTSTINTTVDTNAVYKVGDFSFECSISYDGKTATVVPLSTSAKDMIMSCDGELVTFNRNDMVKQYHIEDITPYNPAVIIYNVLTKLPQSTKTDDAYIVKTPIGDCTVIYDDCIKSITIPDANINIVLNYNKKPTASAVGFLHLYSYLMNLIISRAALISPSTLILPVVNAITGSSFLPISLIQFVPLIWMIAFLS